MRSGESVVEQRALIGTVVRGRDDVVELLHERRRWIRVQLARCHRAPVVGEAVRVRRRTVRSVARSVREAPRAPGEFLDSFTVREVMAGHAAAQASGAVIGKFLRWLAARGYAGTDSTDEATSGAGTPRASCRSPVASANRSTRSPIARPTSTWTRAKIRTG
jgi:hypothetical protein